MYKRQALAFGKILRVCIMHRVTDIYGPIPYSKMMDNDNSGEDLAVPYDSQEQVYTPVSYTHLDVYKRQH